MKEYIIKDKMGLINVGSWAHIKKCMQKAAKGEKVVIGFLGGSITQGSLSSTPETCYAYLVYAWWKRRFPQAQMVYLNAGIGGTSSQYGVARVEEHILKHMPDFVLIEFAVNDENTQFFMETYEGLVRKTYGDKCSPAVLLMNNVRYDDGTNAQEVHLQVAKRYHIPMVSMRSAIYPEISSGKIACRELSPDGLHPNDAGHELVAEVIIHFLERVYDETPFGKTLLIEKELLPEPITANAYENSVCYQNTNSSPKVCGFLADRKPQMGITDVFRNGWTATQKGDKISFVLECTGVAIQYRKSIRKPTPIARVIVDGNEEAAVVLDGNFQEEWGDCLYIDTVMQHMKLTKHTIEISIIEAHENDAVPFYLVSVIASK